MDLIESVRLIINFQEICGTKEMQLAKYRLRGSLQNNLSSFFIENGGEERERGRKKEGRKEREERLKYTSERGEPIK